MAFLLPKLMQLPYELKIEAKFESYTFELYELEISPLNEFLI